MDRFLVKKTRFVAIAFLSAVVVYITLLVGVSQAVNRTATMTGFALSYGTPTAGGKLTNVPGYFANHRSTFCPGDPAAYWAWNTQITMVNPSSVPFRNSSNGAYTRTAFNLWEKGNTSCSRGNYWVDIYFGHSKENPTVNCVCGGGQKLHGWNKWG
jgi:hypothetical protein